MDRKTITLTFGDAGENHVGMEILGTVGEEGSGFTCEELKKISEKLDGEYYDFSYSGIEASILIIRNYLDEKKHIKLFNEMENIEWDTKYYDVRRSKVLNKLARSNIVILDGIEQVPDYENKKGRIVNGDTLKNFKKVKSKIVKKINKILNNNKCDNLICEGNQYFNLKKCGLGYHGDRERSKVLGLRLGQPMNMKWQWFYKSKPIEGCEPYEFSINGGDLYIMSEKAVGNDWLKKNTYTLRHAAGCDKYLSLDKYKKTS